jgi:hypothetical protein
VRRVDERSELVGWLKLRLRSVQVMWLVHSPR